MAQVVVEAGQTDSDGVALAAGGSLTNNGSIINAGPLEPAVFLDSSPNNIAFIINGTTGVITAVDDAGVAIQGDIGEFINRGQITAANFGVGTSGVLVSFRNSGNILSTDDQAVGSISGMGTFINEAGGVLAGATRGIGTDGNIGSFENHGQITAVGDSAVGVRGNVGTFANTGTISSTGGAGVDINGSVGTFDNNGTIEGIGWNPVHIGGGADSFINQATGVIRNNGAAFGEGHGVGFNTDLDSGGAVVSFDNRGLIQGDLASSDSWGVGFFDRSDTDPNAFATGSFANSGTISAAGGVLSRGGFASFDNSGTIIGATRGGVSSDGAVGSFNNSGLIEGARWDAVFLGGGVGSFTNTVTGVIQNTNNDGVAGNGVAFSTDLVEGGAVGSFINEGTISADPNSPDGNGVGFFEDGNGAFTTGSFFNSGTITGTGNGVYFSGGLGTFNNTGSIAGLDYSGVSIDGAVTSFTNSGTITATDGRGVGLYGFVDSFANSGDIVSSANGVTFASGFGSATNSGTIVATDEAGEIGLRIDEAGGTFNNSGTIRGPAGVVYILNAAGPNTFINSGVIDGTAGTAIAFDDGIDGGDDTLILQTGSELYGDVSFGAGTDTLDLTEFRGNALLRVFGLENLEIGDSLAFVEGDDIGVVEPSGLTSAVPLIALDTTTQIRNLIANQLASSTTGIAAQDTALMGYAPVVENSAAGAIADTATEATSANKLWASVLAGGSSDSDPVDLSHVYAGIVAGGHARFENMNLGLLGGITSSEVDTNNGGQQVTATTGILGIYGDTQLGVIDLDFSLMGGGADNNSERRVITPGGVETATADFGSWFLSPSIGLAAPVLSTDQGELKVTGRLSYIGGNADGYTETGSSLNLSVGEQSISLLDARFGLAGEYDAGAGVTLSGNAGLFAQSNFGDSSTSVTLFGQTQGAVVPSSTEWGIYAGAAMSAQIAPSFSLTAGVDGQIRFDGLMSAAAKIGLAGSF